MIPFRTLWSEYLSRLSWWLLLAVVHCEAVTVGLRLFFRKFMSSTESQEPVRRNRWFNIALNIVIWYYLLLFFRKFMPSTESQEPVVWRNKMVLNENDKRQKFYFSRPILQDGIRRQKKKITLCQDSTWNSWKEENINSKNKSFRIHNTAYRHVKWWSQDMLTSVKDRHWPTGMSNDRAKTRWHVSKIDTDLQACQIIELRHADMCQR